MKALIRLLGCAGWSVLLLSAFAQRHVFVWCDPYALTHNTIYLCSKYVLTISQRFFFFFFFFFFFLFVFVLKFFRICQYTLAIICACFNPFNTVDQCRCLCKQCITKTCLFKYIENSPYKNWKKKNQIKKLWHFSYFCSKHRLWVFVRSASAKRF